jgi:EAL domain-containing protein (putative c-di-GMP-specific phosphodiesterase class I)/ActR/RegA family two-component response regulator
MSNEDVNKTLKVIVIDDDDLMLHQVQITLAQINITNVILFNSGKMALAHMETDKPDVIFLDLNMPELDGVEVMRHLALRGFDGGIILFSGEDVRILKTAESLASAHKLNVIGSMSKPVTKASVTSSLKFYSPTRKLVPRPSIPSVSAADLESAIKQGEIQPFFQPKVSAIDKKICSVEVLSRWMVPSGKIIPPIAFIHVAEDHGLINELTFSVFDQALNQLSKWRSVGHKFSLGFNVCADSLSDVDLPEKFAELVQKYKLPFKAIDLEITESKLMQNLTTSLDVLTRLRLKGFGLSIDDFGTGYSSMSQLNQIPFTELKIDRAFVHGVQDDPAAFAILESSATLARKLKMEIVAEGVETQQDWEAVVSVGCNLVQGFFIAKPMSAKDFDKWLTN